MDKNKSIIIQYILVLLLGIGIVVLIVHIRLRSELNISTTFAPDLTYTDNPLMGYAPDSGNIAQCEKCNLVFISLSWAEWEPEDGVYDIEGLERKCNIQRWKESHKHAVLRFVCDIPGSRDHIDIPEWIYEKTENGMHYDTELGKGYSPDYSDPVFIEYHNRALKKLAEYCNKDYFVSFVELGSLGHWGEWHVTGNDGSTLMPDRSVCEEYATFYSDSFVNARLLMRRNYDIAVNGDMGFYNDMIGANKDTEEWLNWIKEGGNQETSGESIELLPVNGLGRRQPVGGEFTSSVPMETMLGSEEIGDVLSSITSSNMTFIGPMVPDLISKDMSLAAESVIRRLGYRIYVSELNTRYNYSGNNIELKLTFKNAGNAGFYFDWPVTVHIFDRDKKQIFWEGLNIDLRDLNSQDEITSVSMIPATESIRDEYYIGVSIVDYTGEENVNLTIDSGGYDEYIDDVRILYHHVKDR
ncbi:MAG: DUF4832 domain-containing protein [Lachnospiraceae bacterium]|nr:DUF4832 domain-containing protein [Lachnospiraceae bacterium]